MPDTPIRISQRMPKLPHAKIGRWKIAVVVALSVLTSSAAESANSLDGAPAIVRAAVKEWTETCKKSKFLSGFVVMKDVNGDGVPDYILDYGEVECDGSQSSYCGTAGCHTQVFASLGNGKYAKVLDDNVRRIRFQTINRRPAMLLDLHGIHCDKVGSAPCPRTLYWSGDRFRAAK